MSLFDTDLDGDDYGDLLGRLLPRGKILSVMLTGTADGLSLTVGALGLELARVHNRLRALLDESDPRSAVEMLDAWERNLQLPDPTDPAPPTVEADRQALAHAKLIGRGGTQLLTLDDVIAAAGYTGVEVQQPAPFRVGFSTTDSRVYDEPWMPVWYVWASTTPAQGWDRLIALLNRIKHSWTEVRAIDGTRANEVTYPTS